MAGITPTTTQQQQLPASAPSSVSGTSADEDAFKRNTDCVYFLASPLTCKKGSECEYRHSENARLNPRDCWYWMHGNCRNPKCSYRHPPLEGFFGAQVLIPAAASVPQSHAANTPVAPTSVVSGSGKQAVPCIFFQKGYCMKGDWCPFLHAPTPISDKVLPSPALGCPVEFTQEKMPPQVNIQKPVELLSQAKAIPTVESTPTKDGPFNVNKHPSSSVDDELHRYRPCDVPSVDNVTQVSWCSQVQQPVSLRDSISINGKDAEEISREPSPGFDVLVDNELGDSVYYPREDQFGRADNCEQRDEYFDSHSGDYSSMVDTDRDMYHDSRGYESYEQHQGQYAWEQHRSSSERMLSGLSADQEGGRYGGTGSPDQVHKSDLRHHLSKHSQTGGLRSVINQDYTCERIDHPRYLNSRQDLRQDQERLEAPLSSRLQGRIKMPGHLSNDGNEFQWGRKADRQRLHSGSSQGSFQLSSRLQNRIKDTTHVDGPNDNRNKTGLPIRRETKGDDNVDFAGPKSLAELKCRKPVETNDQHVIYHPSVSKRKYPHFSQGNLSFDGPKPLKEILKRKRGNEKAVCGIITDSNLDNTQNKVEESLINHAEKAEQQIGLLSPSGNGFSVQNDKGKEISKYNAGVKIEKESALLTDGHSSRSPGHNEAEAEGEGEMMVEDGAEDHAQEDDDYYEQADGEAYDLDEGDNGDPEGEYLHEDDDDDDVFAKKMGVIC